MSEEQFLNKTYYKTFLEPRDDRHPIEVLGEAYVKEQQNLPELAAIRFAQGEVYYAARDYEAAIFKWQNIDSELGPWAKKNMADAYFELEEYYSAESIYKAIATDSSTLNSEILISLFYLYIEEMKLDLAVQMIKSAVLQNPDYRDVTEIARRFFEENKYWDHAIELAVNEATRTETMDWVDSLIDYIENGHAQGLPPAYFYQVQLVVVGNDAERFERLASALWENYHDGEYYFNWLNQFNNLFEAIGVSSGKPWNSLSSLYQETYLYLLDGKYLMNDIVEIMPGLLTNWVKIATNEQRFFAAAAVLAWDEMNSSSELKELVYEADKIIQTMKTSKLSFDHCQALVESIDIWTKVQGIQVSPKLKWIIDRLADLKTQYIIIAGESVKGKSIFYNQLLGELPVDSIETNLLIADSDTEEVQNWTDMDDAPWMSDVSDEQQQTELSNNWSELKLPNVFLRESGLAFIHAEDVYERNAESIHMADSLVFAISDNEPFLEQDRNLFMKLQQKYPRLNVKFLLINENGDQNSNAEGLTTIINSFFPNAEIMQVSLDNPSWAELQDLADFLRGNIDQITLEQQRATKTLFFLQKMLNQIIEKRVIKENNLVHSVNWNGQMVGKLTGAINQLHDVKSESIRNIKKAYQHEIDGIRTEITSAIPELLKGCGALVKESSDFGKIHVELNNEMNKRIDDYIMQTALPKFQDALQRWIETANSEFNKSQSFLKELADGFNSMYEEERVQLEGDFKILNDWRRDVIRMTSIVQIEKVNILNRFTPTQVLLKGAGKLFGALPQNKKLLSSKYKSFIENENYSEIAESVASRLLMQLELFEKGLERDVTMFFTDPEVTLQQLVSETNTTIIDSQSQLNKMRECPERFNDPLAMLQIRLRQYEYVSGSAKETIYQ
ncbi:GTP-binding protein [Bacillus sp. DNRA2]|uniref:tetratricopeptide repeat protein n=1 Tax=Bacillus sp. DNRA2 TaxID=2723053 RepID=UPI00145DE669|nr:GTP-binding protein [Bacillus sp. DNRA2]NMD69703.1 GTP-binding protein [Bacillus sp. DNRA2]